MANSREETEFPLLEFEIIFAALSEVSFAARHFWKPSTPPTTLSDLVLVDELFLIDLRVSLSDVL